MRAGTSASAPIGDMTVSKSRPARSNAAEQDHPAQCGSSRPTCIGRAYEIGVIPKYARSRAPAFTMLQLGPYKSTPRALAKRRGGTGGVQTERLFLCWQMSALFECSKVHFLASECKPTLMQRMGTTQSLCSTAPETYNLGPRFADPCKRLKLLCETRCMVS